MVAIAQLAEHRIVVPSVVGSSPTSHPKETTYGRLFLWLVAWREPIKRGVPENNRALQRKCTFFWGERDVVATFNYVVVSCSKRQASESPTSHPKETTVGRLFLYFQAKYLHTCNIFTTFAAKIVCGISTSVVHRLPKPRRRVRFPYAALRVRQQGRNDCRLRH